MRSGRSLKTLSSLLALGVILGGCARSPEAKSAKFVEAGKKLLQQHDAARAMLQFRNAVQATPKNAEVYYQLGLACLAAGDVPTGVASLRKALELNPKHPGAQLRLSELMSMVNDQSVLKDAQQRLQGLLQDAPDNAEALHTLALTELKLGDQADAMQHLGRAMDAAPQEVLIAITIAETKLQQKDPKGAEEVLKKVCAASPKSVDALIVLGRFYASQNRAGDAEQQFQRALTMDPKSGPALLNLASMQNLTGRKREAEQSFKRLAGLSGKEFKPVYAFFLFQEGRRDEAVREFEKLAKEDSDDRLARTRLVTAYRAVNRAPAAEAILDEALRKNSKDLDALLQRAEMFLASGKYDQAVADLNQLLHLKPDSAETHYILGKVHQARGAQAEYRQELAKVLQLSPFLLTARLELAQSLTAGKGAKNAIDLLNETPPSQKDSLPVLVQRNWALWSLNDMAEVRKGIDRGLLRERSASLLLQDGLWKLKAGDPSGSRAALEESLKADPTNVQALMALQDTYLAQKNAPMALQKVREYAARQPKSAAIQNFLAITLLAHGDRANARAALQLAQAADPKSEEVNLSLARLDMADGNFDEARRKLEAIAAANPGNTTPRLWLGLVAEYKGDKKAAIELFRSVVNANPSEAQALNNLAYLLAEQGNIDEALKDAQKAVELDPDRPAYCDTLGWVLYRKGLYPSAIRYLEKAGSHPENVISKYHLAMAYAKSGDRQRGQTTLEAALKLNSQVPEAQIARDVVSASH